jgi:hypothetical protein
MFRPTELSQIPFIISTPSQGPANARTVTQHRNRNPDRDEINDAKWGATNFVACRETLGKNYGEPHLRLRDIEPRCLYDISDSASEQVRLDPGAHFKKFPLSFSGEYYGRNARVTIAYAALALSERSGISYTECLYFTILIGVYPRSHINRPSSA